jgi:hypothetical protein
MKREEKRRNNLNFEIKLKKKVKIINKSKIF